MTEAASTAHRHVGIGWFAAELFRRDPLYAGAAASLLVLAIPTALAATIDPRTLHGESVWIKPLKFEIALTIYLATLAWFAGWLPDGVAGARWWRRLSAVVVLGVVAEMIWIGGAAAFGVASHFNTTSRAMALIYPMMGLVAVTLMSSSLVLGAILLRHGQSRIEPTLRLGAGTGLVLTFLLTVAVASYMARQPGHAVGGTSAAAGLLGWSRDGGDLRVAHFFATHAMHALPAAGFVAGRLLPARPARLATAATAALYVALVAWTLGEAIAGRPFPLAI